MLLNITLDEIMVRHVIAAHETDTLASVDEKMRVHKIRHVPVLNAAGRLVGMVTYRDLLSTSPLHHTEDGDIFDKEQINQFILKYVMTKDPQTLAPTDSIARAVEIFAREKYGCIPITGKDGAMVGIVTQIDILKWLAKKLNGRAAL